MSTPKMPLLFLAVAVVGCADKRSPSGNGKPSDPKADLVARYRQAHETKNVAAAMKLVWMEGVDDDTKNTLRDNFQGDFERTPTDVQVLPREEDQLTKYTRAGVKYTTNLEVVGNLRVGFEDDGSGSNATTYPLGMKDGRYWITTAVAVGKPAEESRRP